MNECKQCRSQKAAMADGLSPAIVQAAGNRALQTQEAVDARQQRDAAVAGDVVREATSDEPKCLLNQAATCPECSDDVHYSVHSHKRVSGMPEAVHLYSGVAVRGSRPSGA